MNTSVAIPGPDPLPRPVVAVVLLVAFYAVTDPFMLFVESYMDAFVGMKAEIRHREHDSYRYRKLRRHMGTWPSWGRAIMLRAKGGKLS